PRTVHGRDLPQGFPPVYRRGPCKLHHAVQVCNYFLEQDLQLRKDCRQAALCRARTITAPAPPPAPGTTLATDLAARPRTGAQTRAGRTAQTLTRARATCAGVRPAAPGRPPAPRPCARTPPPFPLRAPPGP